MATSVQSPWSRRVEVGELIGGPILSQSDVQAMNLTLADPVHWVLLHRSVRRRRPRRQHECKAVTQPRGVVRAWPRTRRRRANASARVEPRRPVKAEGITFLGKGMFGPFRDGGGKQPRATRVCRGLGKGSAGSWWSPTPGRTCTSLSLETDIPPEVLAVAEAVTGAPACPVGPPRAGIVRAAFMHRPGHPSAGASPADAGTRPPG
jgi:hypothetical protein